MRAKLTLFLERYWMLLALGVMLPVYWNIAVLNEQRVDYINNGFFKFWLAGRMTWTAEHPYSLEDWDAGHKQFGATWMDEKRFAYPLPLALIVSPLGLLPIKTAYILWDFLAQILIAVCLLWLATHWEGLNRRLYVLFLLAAATLNGNIYLGLMTGTVAALFLVFLTLALFFLEKKRDVLAGFFLSLVILKPPLVTILILMGLWLLFSRRWRVIGGMALGERRRAWRKQEQGGEIHENAAVTGEQQSWALQLDDVRRALLDLPEDQREALVLVGAGGLSYEEAASVCGCAVGTMKPSAIGRAQARPAARAAPGASAARPRWSSRNRC